jgi:hypothetical protein
MFRETYYTVEQVVCFKQIHGLRFVVWVLTTQWPTLGRRPFSIHLDYAVCWVDLVLEAIGIGTISGAIGCVPPETFVDSVDCISSGCSSVGIRFLETIIIRN